jgi:hypothetical protein
MLEVESKAREDMCRLGNLEAASIDLGSSTSIEVGS